MGGVSTLHALDDKDKVLEVFELRGLSGACIHRGGAIAVRKTAPPWTSSFLSVFEKANISGSAPGSGA
jgi:hypothetical protein